MGVPDSPLMGPRRTDRELGRFAPIRRDMPRSLLRSGHVTQRVGADDAPGFRFGLPDRGVRDLP